MDSNVSDAARREAVAFPVTSSGVEPSSSRYLATRPDTASLMSALSPEFMTRLYDSFSASVRPPLSAHSVMAL